MSWFGDHVVKPWKNSKVGSYLINSAVGDWISDASYVASGDYQDDAEKLNEKSDTIDAEKKNLTKLQEDPTVVMGEIFQLSVTNDIRDELDTLNSLVADYNALAAKVVDKTDALDGGGYIKPFIFETLNIVGGIENAVEDIARGKDVWQNVKNLAHLIGDIFVGIFLITLAMPFLVVGAILSATPVGWFLLAIGIATFTLGVAALVDAAVFASVTYGSGAYVDIMFQAMDLVFNKVGHLNKVSKAFNNFKKDGDYYMEWKANFVAGVQYAALAAALVAARYSPPSVSGSLGKALGLGSKTVGALSLAYDAMQTYDAINDIVNANDKQKELEAELDKRYADAKVAITSAAKSKRIRSFMQVGNIQQDDEDIAIASYVSSVAKDGTTVIDPEMLIKGNPDTDRSAALSSSAFSFGYEDVVYGHHAGSYGYIDGIIHKLYEY